MDKKFFTFMIAIFVFVSMGFVSAKSDMCSTIKSGDINDSKGEVIELGYDDWGYNYQAHMFNGMYCDSYRNASWCQPYTDISLSMKWNDAWLSNKDCVGDGLLDRHYGHSSYFDSGAWLTNHQSGTYEQDNVTCEWDYFVKIVAVSSDDVNINGTWYNVVGEEIGPVIWGEFAIIQEVSNDPCAGDDGVTYKSPLGPGFGKFN